MLVFDVARFGFGAGFERCRASFITLCLWEETLRNCPKPISGFIGLKTTILDNKTIIYFFTKYFLFSKIKQRESHQLMHSSRKHGGHGASPLSSEIMPEHDKD